MLCLLVLYVNTISLQFPNVFETMETTRLTYHLVAMPLHSRLCLLMSIDGL